MEGKQLSHKERMQACLEGSEADRPPVALWRHFPVDDQAPDTLAAATLEFQRTFDFDFVKVSPASSFATKDWGVRDEWQGDPEGTRSYTQRVIDRSSDWEKLPVLGPDQEFLAAQIAALRLIVGEIGPDTPVIQTIFNPLAQAKNLAGKERLLVHMRRYPEALHAGLRIIAETTRRFIEAAIETGIAGVFYAVQHAQYGLLSEQEYLEFGRQYDLQVLEPAKNLWLNVLHLHGTEVMFSTVLKGRDGDQPLPVQVVNWHDRETAPMLNEAQELFSGTVCGGLRTEQMVLGAPDDVREEARQAINVTGGKRFVLGTGCVIPIITPYGNIVAARRAVEA